MSELHRELSRIEFEMRENSMTHTPVENEMRFYEAVKRGDMDAARTLSTPLGGEGFGVLSTDRLRNLKYHLVVTVSFITRFCVEGGMERETAYNLSDLYIRKADLAASAEEINAIHSELITDFTERMAKLKNGSSRLVRKCHFKQFYAVTHNRHACILEKLKLVGRDSEAHGIAVHLKRVAVASLGKDCAVKGTDERPACIVHHRLDTPVVLTFHSGEALVYVVGDGDCSVGSHVCEFLSADGHAVAPTESEILVDGVSACGSGNCCD